MSFLAILKIDFIKVKRSKVLPVLFVAPLLIVISVVGSIAGYMEYMAGYTWQAMFVQGGLLFGYFPGLLFGYFLLPFSIIVICTLVSGREQQNKGTLKMLSLPIDRSRMAMAKFVVLLCYVGLEILVNFLCFVVVGVIATHFIGIDDMLPISYILKWCTFLFLTAIPLTALIWTITVLIGKPVISVGLNFLLVIPSILVANTPLWIIYPYSYSGYLITMELDRLSRGAERLDFDILPFILCALLILFGCLFILSRRSWKKEI
jgi:hypothetical protein